MRILKIFSASFFAFSNDLVIDVFSKNLEITKPTAKPRTIRTKIDYCKKYSIIIILFRLKKKAYIMKFCINSCKTRLRLTN